MRKPPRQHQRRCVASRTFVGLHPVDANALLEQGDRLVDVLGHGIQARNVVVKVLLGIERRDRQHLHELDLRTAHGRHGHRVTVLVLVVLLGHELELQR